MGMLPVQVMQLGLVVESGGTWSGLPDGEIRSNCAGSRSNYMGNGILPLR